jgi:hypothetical protein
MYQELSDEQLEMVAGGTLTQNATATASLAQSATSALTGSPTSASLTFGAVQTGGPNTAAAASTADAGNIVQSATNIAVAANFSKSFNGTFQF